MLEHGQLLSACTTISSELKWLKAITCLASYLEKICD